MADKMTAANQFALVDNLFLYSSFMPVCSIVLPNRLYTEFAMSRVTELFHRSINMTIPWLWFPASLLKTHRRDNDARTVRL